MTVLLNILKRRDFDGFTFTTVPAMNTNAQLRGNNTQAKLGAKRLGLRVICPSERQRTATVVC